MLNIPYSIVFGDSPELSIASYSLGIAHPPGYPLYSLLTKAFNYLLPLSDYAQKCNIFSAFISSISIVIAFISTYTITNNYVASLISSVLIGFSYLFFKQSLIAEVYALNSFFVLIISFCIIQFEKKGDARWSFLSLDIFLNDINLTNEEIFFLKPYIPFLTEKAFVYYSKNNLLNSEKLLPAVYKINPTIENALNYSLLLAMNKKLNEAEKMEKQLYTIF